MESMWEEYKGGEDAYLTHMLQFEFAAMIDTVPLYNYEDEFDNYVYVKGAWSIICLDITWEILSFSEA